MSVQTNSSRSPQIDRTGSQGKRLTQQTPNALKDRRSSTLPCVPSQPEYIAPIRVMHSIKRAAHQESWYGDGDQRTYNPFQKIHSRTGSVRYIHSDIEARHSQPPIVRGNTNHSAPITQRSPPSNDGYRPPKHASTMPVVPQTGRESTEFPKEIEINPNHNQNHSEDSNATSETIVPPQNTGSESSVRSRFRFRKMFKRHKDSENSEDDEEKEPPQKFTAMGQIRATILNSYINVLLIAAPVGIALSQVKSINPVVVFVVNFIAIIPLAAMLSYATEEIALRTGETIGGLLNATFGNAVELIVSILALTQNQVLIVQTSLIGSMLSNLLLVMGMCFFFGGLNRVEQYFNVTVAQTASSLLALAIGSLIIPTAFYLWASGSTGDKTTEVTSLSRGVAILLLIIYGSYLFFQLKTHTDMYNEPSKKVGKRRVKAKAGDALRGMVQGGANMSAAVGGDIQKNENIMQLDDDKDKPQLSVLVAILTLAISTALVAVCAEFMVDSINALTTGPHGISKTFVGLILLPIVGNAAEHATAVTVACKDKMDLAIGVAVGSSLQIALFVLPFIVVIGWCMGNDTMNLNFDGFQVAVLFVAVLLVNYLITDGKSHWLEGAMLQVLYLIIAIAAWFYPEPTTTS